MLLTQLTRRHSIYTGVSVSLSAALTSQAISLAVPTLSPMLVAIALGIVAANSGRLPSDWRPGIEFSAKSLLRAGIVLLGLQVSLISIASLGISMLCVVVTIVAGGILSTLFFAKLLRIAPRLSVLIACGFSICGAAAVAGAASSCRPARQRDHDQDTLTAVALVVIYGTLMIPALPVMAHLFGLTEHASAIWAGGSIHEIAQVIAVGSVLGHDALSAAVLVKLARVLMLAPVVAILGAIRRRRQSSLFGDENSNEPLSATPPTGARPALMPGFVVGFIAMMLIRTWVPLPGVIVGIGSVLHTGLLAAAMFALGCGIEVRSLRHVGFKPFVLAALSTLSVATISLVGITLVSP